VPKADFTANYEPIAKWISLLIYIISMIICKNYNLES
jgi:hypothetical protein